MSALRLLQDVGFAAFLLGVYLWAIVALSWLAGGEPRAFEASLAVAGGALIAGVWSAAAWSARAVLRTARNLQTVERRLARFAPAPADDSEALTRAATARACETYERARNAREINAHIIGDLRRGAAL